MLKDAIMAQVNTELLSFAIESYIENLIYPKSLPIIAINRNTNCYSAQECQITPHGKLQSRARWHMVQQKSPVLRPWKEQNMQAEIFV